MVIPILPAVAESTSACAASWVTVTAVVAEPPVTATALCVTVKFVASVVAAVISAAVRPADWVTLTSSATGHADCAQCNVCAVSERTC